MPLISRTVEQALVLPDCGLSFPLWQLPAMAQAAQPLEHECFPFFLFLTRLRIISETIASKRSPTIMFPIKNPFPKGVKKAGENFCFLRPTLF